MPLFITGLTLNSGTFFADYPDERSQKINRSTSEAARVIQENMSPGDLSKRLPSAW